MGRTLPTECKHGHVWDWGDFGGCNHDDWDESCRYCNPPECPSCLKEAQQRRKLWRPL